VDSLRASEQRLSFGEATRVSVDKGYERLVRLWPTDPPGSTIGIDRGHSIVKRFGSEVTDSSPSGPTTHKFSIRTPPTRSR